MWSWACTELGFSLIGIIRRMCSFGTYVRLIRGSLIVEKFSCAWLSGHWAPTTTSRPPAWALSKHRPFDSINTRSQKLGSAPYCSHQSAIMPPQRVPLMIKLPWSMDVPNLQIPGSWLFLLIVIYVGSHCCPTLGPFEAQERGCARGERLHHPAGCSINLHREAKSTSHIHLVPFTNWQQCKKKKKKEK